MTTRRERMLAWLAALLLAWLPLAAGAQTLEDLSVSVQGGQVVARLGFNANVRFLQQSPPGGTADLYRVTFELVSGDESVINQSTAEARELAAGSGLPGLRISYAPNTGQRTRQLTVQLGAPQALRVRQGPTPRSIDFVFAAAPAAAAPEAAEASAPSAMAAPAAPVAPASADIEERAAALMARGRDALLGKRHDEAVTAFNQLLLLPPNTQSKEAQELIGVAWEQAGSPRRAKVEYELYLRLFPGDEAATRVAQRLAALGLGPSATRAAAAPAGPAEAASAPAPAATPSRYNGSIAQYYFGGKARSQTLVSDPNSGVAQATLSRTTESAIVTSVDLGARFSTPESETRVVVRGTGSTNLQSTSHNPSLLNAAYVDYKRTESGLAVRLGRQTAISGGLLGLFDGVSLSYPVRQGLKVDLMGGAPANTLVGAPSQRLLAGVLELDGLLERWGGNVYLVDQTSEGIVNRRAVGAELRYSDDRMSLYSLLDYDTLFRSLNAVSLQGSLQAPAQTTVTLLLDARKAPSLERTNALISTGAASLKDLMQAQTLSLDQVTALARSTSATAKQALLSLSRPVSERWQLGVDLRYSAIGALPAIGNFDATPATGAQYGLSTLLTGSNLYSSRDINTFSLSVLSTPSLKGTQLAYNNLTGLRGDDLTLEPSMRVYVQNDNLGIRTRRLTPGLRVSYKVSTRASLLGETLVEHSKVDGPNEHDSTTSVFFYVGYRYELF